MNEDNFHLGIKALIRNSKGEYLLLKTNKARIDKEYYDIPGGRIKRGEDIINTLKREVFEETGINEISNIKELGMTVANIRIPLKTGGDVGLILMVFEASIPDNSKVILSDEHIDFGFFDKDVTKELLSVKYPIEFLIKIL
jgi:8-oxo-dGTP diphosphatase